MKTALALLICCPLLAAPAQAFDWTGFYAGVGIGGMSAGYEDGSGLNVSQGATSLEGLSAIDVLNFFEERDNLRQRQFTE